jgi:protein-tyrosine phosphatase
VYIRLLELLGPELRVILERAVDSPDRPLLFHCAAGKDRTGIVAAVLLGLLGVPDDVILDDYELTTRYFTERKLATLAGHMAEYGVSEERLRPLLEARRPVLAAMLDHVHERWGDFDGYAHAHVGLDSDFVERLQASLLA